MRVSTRRSSAAIGIGVLVALGLGTAAVQARPHTQTPGRTLDPDTRFYTPPPVKGAVQQVARLKAQGRRAEAARVAAMIETPQAVWFTSGSPKQVKQDARNTMARARAKGTVPVLVAYFLPFRDCGQYSAGGALDTASYLAWIDGLADGIGDGKAVVILEPDGLGIIPYNTDINGNAEWCQPDLTGTGLTPTTANSERYAQLNGAVDRLAQQPNVSVYLDGTHSAWLGVGDIADRLVRAGVARAQGFYLNASNYQYTVNSIHYGTWISSCIASGIYAGCANQYWNGGPLPTKIAQLLGEWTGVALSPYGEWSAESDDPALNTSGIDFRNSTPGTTHFVIDTSRNGVGPWQPPAGVYSDPQDWCNPPDRGLGLRPTADTGRALVDAYLWIKIPGASDGECFRGTAGPLDPERGIVDPPAGAWFPEMALELVANAVPPLP